MDALSICPVDVSYRGAESLGVGAHQGQDVGRVRTITPE